MAIETVLVVDDDIRTRELLSAFLGTSRLSVSFAQSGTEAAAVLKLKPFDLVITDMYMPDGDGIEVIQHLRRHYPQVRIIAMTGPWVIRAEEYLNQARSLSVDAILMKPFLREHVLAAISNLQAPVEAPASPALRTAARTPAPEYVDH